MKKINAVTALLLASGLLLTGCNQEKPCQHVDEDKNGTCDICDADVAAVTAISFEGTPTFADVAEEIDFSEFLSVTAVNGASEEVTWSVDNEKVASVSEEGVVTMLKNGIVNVSATSTFDGSLVATSEVKVVFEREFASEDYGYEFTTTFPVEMISEFADTTAENIFIPSEEVIERGMWVKEVEAQGSYAGYVDIIFNIGGNDSELGNSLVDDELAQFEDYYYYYDPMEYQDWYVPSDLSYQLMWGATYNADYSDGFLTFTYYRSDELFLGPEKTTNTDWTDEEKGIMNDVLGTVVPFVKMGEEYEVLDDGEGDVMIVDFSYDHNIIDEYKEVLLSKGYVYSQGEGAYYKFTSKDTTVILKTMFTSYGNTMLIYSNATPFAKFPSMLVSEYVYRETETTISIPSLVLENDNPYHEFRAYWCDDSADTYDYFEFAESYYEITALLATYDDFINYAVDLMNAGFDLVGTASYDRNHIGAILLQYGALEVYMEISPQEEFDWSDFPPVITTDFNKSTIIVDFYHSENFNFPGVNFYVDEITIDEGEIADLKYALTGVTGVTFTSSNENVVTVDEEGTITGVSGGTATIKAQAGYYTAMITVNVNWGPSDDNIDFYYDCDYFPSAIESIDLDNVTLTFAKGEGADAPESDYYNVLTLYPGNTVTFTAKNGHTLNEVEFIDYYNGSYHAAIEVVGENGTMEGMRWFAADLETTSVTFKIVSTGNGAYIEMSGFKAFYDDTKLHSSKLSVSEIAETIADIATYEYYDVISCTPYNNNDYYEDFAWSIVIAGYYTAALQNYYGLSTDEALGYEMADLIDWVLSSAAYEISGLEDLPDLVYEAYDFDDHYLYGYGVFADVEIGDLEFEIGITLDDSNNPIIQIDIWDWANF